MPKNIHNDKILILDFGSQYTQLIARRVREAGVYCELYPYDVSEKHIKDFNPSGIILSGGPESVHVDNQSTPKINNILFKLNIPILGICYGMQAMAHQLGGKVSHSDKKEFGHAEVEINKPNLILEGVGNNNTLEAWMSHGDKVVEMPEGFNIIASSNNTSIVAFENLDKKYFGLQFHPEVSHTKQGFEILKNFVHNICNCGNNWTPENIIQDQINIIKNKVGSDQVILGLSGGVDSSVVAAMLHKAIGKQLTCVFVDHGLLRLNEADEVMRIFSKNMGLNIIKVDAKELFFKKLENISCPEQKRKVIGNCFIEVFEKESSKLINAKWLAQGTIYPDVIESAGSKTGKAKVIKSHHNVGGLPENMKLSLLEPLRELFKDEVRKIGTTLGLPFDMIYRHPFPGPGLGVRILGEIKEEYINILQKADNIFINLLHKYDLYHKVSQAFAVFLPIKSVGVTGDNRKYDYVVALRAVETVDFMTAKWARLPYDLLDEASHRIINEVPGISRVTYDISGKPPATIEWE